MGSVQEMKISSYARLGRRWRRSARGFRLSPTRLSVRRLRAKLWTLLGLMGRYVRNVRLLTRGLIASNGGGSAPTATSGGRGGRVPVCGGAHDGGGGGRTGGKGGQAAAQGAAGNSGKVRRPPCMRSNSFYARAVAECLDFIKGSNAAPVEDSRAAAAAAAAAVGARHGHGQQQMLKAT